MIIIFYVLGGMVLWTVGWLAFYFLLEARHDASGDGGLAFGAIALLPWLAPYLLYQAAKEATLEAWKDAKNKWNKS